MLNRKGHGAKRADENTEPAGTVSTRPRRIAAVSGGPDLGAGALSGVPRRSARRLGAVTRSGVARAARQWQDRPARLVAAGSRLVRRRRRPFAYARRHPDRGETRRAPSAGILVAAPRARTGLRAWDHVEAGPERRAAAGRGAARTRAEGPAAPVDRRGAHAGRARRPRTAERWPAGRQNAAVPAGAGGHSEPARSPERHECNVLEPGRPAFHRPSGRAGNRGGSAESAAERRHRHRRRRRGAHRARQPRLPVLRAALGPGGVATGDRC